MLDQHYKELWEARFQRVLRGEEEAIAFYKQLLKDNEALLLGTKAKILLKEILRDEAKHARIAHELIKLVKQKKISEGEKQ